MEEGTLLDRILGRSRLYKPKDPPRSDIAKSCAAVGETEEATIVMLDAEIAMLRERIDSIRLESVRRRDLTRRAAENMRERCAVAVEAVDDFGSKEYAATIRAVEAHADRARPEGSATPLYR